MPLAIEISVKSLPIRNAPDPSIGAFLYRLHARECFRVSKRLRLLVLDGENL